MLLPGKPGSSGVYTALYFNSGSLYPVKLIAALSEYNDLPAPLHMMQSAFFSSSNKGSRLCLSIAKMFSRILFAKPMLLILPFKL